MKLNTNVRHLAGGKREIYPTKRSMNLYFKEDQTTAPATAALYILFALVVLLALSKVMIYDPLNTVAQLEAQALALEERTASQLTQLKDYRQVLKDYTRATPTQEELSQVDRMEILDLIDRVIRPAADISQVSIADHQVLCIFSDITLEQAGELISLLEQSPLVTKTSVDTAASIKGNQRLVEVHVYFEVAREGGSQP